MTGAVTPLRVIYGEPLRIRVQSRGRHFGKGHLWPLGRPALRGPCRASDADRLAQGKVILAASTFRRLKMRWDLCSGTSMTAQFRCSSTEILITSAKRLFATKSAKTRHPVGPPVHCEVA